MADIADVAVIAIEPDLPAARLLAQDLRSFGVEAAAFAPNEAGEALRLAAAVVFYATDQALTSDEWRGAAVLTAAQRIAAVVVALAKGADAQTLANVLPTDRTAPANADAIIDLIADEFDLSPPQEQERSLPPGAGGAPGPLFPPVLGGSPAEEAAASAPDAVHSIEEELAPPPAARKRAVVRSPAPVSDRDAAAAPAEAPPIEQATLYENAPRKMRLGVRRQITVRISAEQAAAEGMTGEVSAHAIAAAQVMTVTLDDPDFAFAIRPLTPATQWIDRSAIARLGFLGAAQTAEWRWSVEPIRAGAHRLSISASARIADPSGVTADANLPPQVIDVSVTVAPSRVIARAARWAAVAIGAAVLGHFSVAILDALTAVLG